MLHRLRQCLVQICLLLMLLTLGACSTITEYIPIPTLDWFSSDDKADPRAVRAAKAARSQAGVPYRYGGTTPRGFDCSGLIWWAYKKQGVKIPRVSEDQLRAGRNIRSRKAIQPGDIIVFKTGRGRSGLHVALYIGNQQFIHAPTSGKHVRIDSMKNTYWSPKLISIRRIL